jgi:hypothetical protein
MEKNLIKKPNILDGNFKKKDILYHVRGLYPLWKWDSVIAIGLPL